MKFPRLAKTVNLVKSVLGIKEIPVAEGKIALSDEHAAKLKKTLGDDGYKQVIEAFNKEITTVLKNEKGNEELSELNQQLEEARTEMAEILKETNLSDDEKKELIEGKGNTENLSLTEQLSELKTQMAAYKKAQKEQNELVQKLINDPEGDSPEAIIQRGNGTMKHSATHLFASNKVYDSFKDRPWNARMRDMGIQATDFNEKGTIPLLQDDVEHFVRENPEALESLFNDTLDLPKEWSRRSGVLDRTSTGTILPDEITQGRKKGWSPKNNFKIEAEEGRVFPKKIDITFDGAELQEIETTWIRGYNKEGSHPWKMHFVGFLLSELVKQQRLDTRVAMVNGLYAKTPDGDGKPGRAVNSQNGIRFLWWYYRDIAKKYRPFSMGEPTPANIVDYVDQLIKKMPEEDRKEQGLELQISTEKLQWYRTKAGAVYQLHMVSDEGKREYKRNHPIDYPNIMFQELTDMTGTSFMGITKSKNVEVMDYNKNEKSKFTITHEKRDTHIFADWREGIRFRFVGTKLLPGEPAVFEKQVVWSNDVPIFDSSVMVPAFDIKQNKILTVSYNNIKIDEDYKSNIESIEGATPGTIIKITGNTNLAAAKYVVDNATISLADNANFDLSSGGTLTLYVKADGTFKELTRTTEPEVNDPETTNKFAGGSIDAKEHQEFFFTGDADDQLDEILNGVDGKTIKIYGSDAANADFTVTDVAGNIDVDEDAVLADSNDFIELIKVDGVWLELSRTIAPVA